MPADLDEFQLIKPLGKGGMGVVYRARDTILDRNVAIKLIGVLDPNATARDRFLTEARAIARLSHPNVVSIYRVGTTSDGRPYLVQELVEGTSLDKLPRPVSWRRAIEYGLGIARGVAAAHRCGILHRDLKPANVMLDDKDHIRILDFGLAKLTTDAPRERAAVQAPSALDPDRTADSPLGPAPTVAIGSPQPATHQTVAGALIGTPRYLAPELWRGDPATVRSDVYAIGVLLFEMIAGEPPYPEHDMASLQDAVVNREPPKLATRADVPGWVGDLVDRCLARDPERRPASAIELGHGIEHGLSGGAGVPEGNPYRGLASFGAEHRAVFFGRGLDVTELVERLRVESLVVVAGDSGIGKSSVIHAGVVPAITSGSLADGRTWRAVTVVPGRRPYAALCDALATDGDAAPNELVRAARLQHDAGLVVVIDQLEELVTLADRAEAASATRLLAALADGVPGIRVIAAVRGDFLTRVAALPELAGPMARGLHLLRALTETDLREAVVGPARAKGTRFASEKTVEALVDAVKSDPGALPLLQFALAELWNARDAAKDEIPDAALAELGGVAGALARHADRVVLAMPAPDRQVARRILLRLVTPANTRATLPATELDEQRSVLEVLVRGRLVVARETVDAPEYVLAHEALISSWAMLRDWLADNAGERVLRDRLAAAASEWRRDNKRADGLWSARQVQAVAHVTELGASERAFLDASRRRIRRARWRLGIAIATLPLAIAATATILRVRASNEAQHAIDARVVAAERHAAIATAAERDANAARALAFADFERGAAARGELSWSRAREASTTARNAYRDSSTELEHALAIDGDHAHVRDRLGEVLLAHATLAETFFDQAATADLARRAAVYAPGRATAWAAPAKLTVDASHAQAITVRPYVDRDGRLELGDAVARGNATLSATLPPGSYLVEASGATRANVRAPIVLARRGDMRLTLALPLAADVPPGFVYVPAGSFLTGSDLADVLRHAFLHTPPLLPISTGAYLIARHEVTLGEWIDFLETLPTEERDRRRPKAGESELVAVGDAWELRLKPTSHAYRVRSGEPLVYLERDRRASMRWERFPVFGIDLGDARAYAAWLSETKRVPGARLCTGDEWERAARGADGRPFPHGHVVAQDDANIDITYGRRERAYGPDEVGSHPASDSPFGVSDQLGNVWEWVEDPKPVVRGGGWYVGQASGLVMNHDYTNEKMRDLSSGIRICASAPAAR